MCNGNILFDGREQWTWWFYDVDEVVVTDTVMLIRTLDIFEYFPLKQASKTEEWVKKANADLMRYKKVFFKCYKSGKDRNQGTGKRRTL